MIFFYKYTVTSDFIVACIGADEKWEEYMVLVFVDQFKSIYGGKKNWKKNQRY